MSNGASLVENGMELCASADHKDRGHSVLKKFAFLEYGVELKAHISSVSGFTESPKELVVSLWEHDFNEDFSRYHGHMTAWSGAGEKRFRKQVLEANRERLPIRVVLATSQQPDMVRAGRASDADNDFVPRFDLVGWLINLDRDNVEFKFEKTGTAWVKPTVQSAESVAVSDKSDETDLALSTPDARYWRAVEAIEALGEGTVAETVAWLESHYPGDPLGDPRASLEHVTVNATTRPHYDKARSNWRSDSGHPRDRLFKVTEKNPIRTTYIPFDPTSHGHVDLQKSAEGKWEVVQLPMSELALAEAEAQATAPPLPIDSDHDSRVWAMKAIAQRQGQSLFRSMLVEAYDGKCAVTGSNATAVLEAAHIEPYRGTHTNRIDNGLLLRSDIHTLFDLGLVWLTADYLLVVAPSLKGSDYEAFDGLPLRLPTIKAHLPNPAHLMKHAQLAREKNGLPDPAELK